MAVHVDVRNLKTHMYTRSGVVKALDGVSLTINEGETLGLVGESGSGKSTFCHSLLKLLPKAARIVSGQILLHGEDLVPKSEREMTAIRGNRISMILQDPMTSLDPVFTVGSQLAETISRQGGWRGHRVWDRATDLLRMVRLPAPEARLKSFPHQLSGGMRQRVAGAVALARQPQFLIADEPTSALDVITQANYLSLLEHLREKVGLTLLFVTHDFGVVSRICDRVAVMYAGKLVEVGTVREIFDEPLHPYTIALLQSVPRVDQQVDRLANITGQPPSLLNLPPGCVFQPRCRKRKPTCKDDFPPTSFINGSRQVCCWRYA